MATTKSSKERRKRPKDSEGGGGGGGDSPIVVGGGGGNKRLLRRFMKIEFDRTHFKKVAGKSKWCSNADPLRLLKINDRPKNVRNSDWMKVYYQDPTKGYGEVTIWFDPVCIEFSVSDLPVGGPSHHQSDDWYITGVYANGAGTLYQYPGFGNTNCEIKVNPLEKRRSDKRSGSSASATKRAATKRR